MFGLCALYSRVFGVGLSDGPKGLVSADLLIGKNGTTVPFSRLPFASRLIHVGRRIGEVKRNP